MERGVSTSAFTSAIFYTAHNYLIPENVTLRLNHYAGAQVTFMNEIKGTAEDAIKKANESELQIHRGHLKQILSYAGLAVLSIATAGAAYVVAGTINYVCNGQFFFSTKVNTDSINKVNELQASVEELIGSPLTV